MRNPDESTDTEILEVMRKVKNNLNRRNHVPLNMDVNGSNLPDDSKLSVEQDFHFIHDNSNIQDDTYIIKSHRPVIGYFLIKGRELINAEVKRYTGPIFFKQSLFNGSLVRIISEARNAIFQNQNKITEIEQSTNANSEQISELKDRISALSQEKEQLKTELLLTIDKKCEKYDTYMKYTDNTKWSELYSKDISEKDLIENVEYHTCFIELIRKYANLSSKSKIPKIIEIGLGNGTMSIFFSRDELYEVYGIDNNVEVMRYCIYNNKKLGGYAKFLLIDAFDLNLLRKKEFDVAFSQGTLEHFDNDSILKLLSNQLELANYVVFSVPSVNWATREIGNERKMTVEEWRTLLNEGNFNIVNLEYYKDNLHIVGVISQK